MNSIMQRKSLSINDKQFFINCHTDNDQVKIVYEGVDIFKISIEGKLPVNRNIKNLVDCQINKIGFIGNIENYIIDCMIKTYFDGKVVNDDDQTNGEDKWINRSAIIDNKEVFIKYIKENDKLIIKHYMEDSVKGTYAIMEGYIVNKTFRKLNTAIHGAGDGIYSLDWNYASTLYHVYLNGVDYVEPVLFDKTLQGIDPFDGNLSHEQKMRIAEECRRNPTYFYNEALKTPSSNEVWFDLSFGEALLHLEKGKRLSRTGWNGKNMFIYYVPPASYPVQTGAAKEYFGENSMVPYNAYFAIKNVDDTVSTWVPSVNDCLAKDWYIKTDNVAVVSDEGKIPQNLFIHQKTAVTSDQSGNLITGEIGKDTFNKTDLHLDQAYGLILEGKKLTFPLWGYLVERDEQHICVRQPDSRSQISKFYDLDKKYFSEIFRLSDNWRVLE